MFQTEFVYVTQRSHSECGSAMDLWRSFRAAVSDMSSVASIRTRFLVAVEMSLPGNVMSVDLLLQFQRLNHWRTNRQWRAIFARCHQTLSTAYKERQGWSSCLFRHCTCISVSWRARHNKTRGALDIGALLTPAIRSPNRRPLPTYRVILRW